MNSIVFTTTANPEVLRQALELILGRTNENNQWYISTAGDQATVVSTLDETEVQVINEFVNGLTSIPSELSKYYSYSNGAFSENLAALRSDACAKIDAEAGKTRLKYLTSIPGQDATYIAKEAECRAFRAAGYPEDLSEYSWVQSEVEATGLTATQAADAIILQADQWKAVGCAIEKTRRGGKIEIGKKLKSSTIQTSLSATLATLQGL